MITQYYRPYVVLFLFNITAVLSFSCEDQGVLPLTGELDNTGTIGEYLPSGANSGRPQVCDPFGLNEEYVGREMGLAGKLFYASQINSSRYYSVQDYIDLGIEANGDIYFNQVNVPTRPWNRAFHTTDGQSLLNDLGEPVYEFFGISLESQIQLSNNDGPGLYQFALLSDDGSILELNQDENGDFESFIDNDGDHPTKMKCAASAVRMDYTTRLPMRLKYYQGPRYHISMIMLWREIEDTGIDEEIAAQLFDSECDRLGNSRYFDSTQDPPVPSQIYLDMLDRGWKVLRPGNFVMPQSNPENPCEELCPVGGCLDIDIGV